MPDPSEPAISADPTPDAGAAYVSQAESGHGSQTVERSAPGDTRPSTSADQPGDASPSDASVQSSPASAPAFAGATDDDFERAHAALLEITDAGSIGERAGSVDEGDGVVTVYFDVTSAGYPGWRWTASIAHVEGLGSSVLETEMTPGDEAVLAPDWVPWVDRLADYRAAQDAEASASETDETDEPDDDELDDDEPDDDELGDDEVGDEPDDDDDEPDDDDDEPDDDDDDDDGLSVGSLLHAGDLDGVDIDDLDDSAADDTDTDDTDTSSDTDDGASDPDTDMSSDTDDGASDPGAGTGTGTDADTDAEVIEEAARAVDIHLDSAAVGDESDGPGDPDADDYGQSAPMAADGVDEGGDPEQEPGAAGDEPLGAPPVDERTGDQ